MSRSPSLEVAALAKPGPRPLNRHPTLNWGTGALSRARYRQPCTDTTVHAILHDHLNRCPRRFRFARSTTCMRVWCGELRRNGSPCRRCGAGRRLDWRGGHRSRSGWRGPIGAPPRCPRLRCSTHWTSGAASGQLLVVDASCLFEVVADAPRAGEIATRLSSDANRRRRTLSMPKSRVCPAPAGRLDGTAAAQAVADLRDRPGERFGHRWLLERAWQLRDSVRGRDALRGVGGGVRCDPADAGRPVGPRARANVPDRGPRHCRLSSSTGFRSTRQPPMSWVSRSQYDGLKSLALQPSHRKPRSITRLTYQMRTANFTDNPAYSISSYSSDAAEILLCPRQAEPGAGPSSNPRGNLPVPTIRTSCSNRAKCLASRS